MIDGPNRRVAGRHTWEPSSAPPPLERRHVHVWLAALDRPPAAVERHLAVLSPDERERARRFHFDRDRVRFVAARGIVRALLGRYLGLDPAAVSLHYGPRGKPSLAPPADAEESVHFNVSHSGGLGLFAFARGPELGIDLECEHELLDAEAIVRRFFSPSEAEAFFLLPAGQRKAAFFRCWTRKEAFIKATGDGLARPLDSFDVTLLPGEPARLVRTEGDAEEAAGWWLEGLEPAEGFAAALAVRGRPDAVACWTVAPEP